MTREVYGGERTRVRRKCHRLNALIATDAWIAPQRFKAEIVNYADDFAVLGRAPAAVMLDRACERNGVLS